jgi:hypothetical protein
MCSIGVVTTPASAGARAPPDAPSQSRNRILGVQAYGFLY